MLSFLLELRKPDDNDALTMMMKTTMAVIMIMVQVWSASASQSVLEMENLTKQNANQKLLEHSEDNINVNRKQFN